MCNGCQIHHLLYGTLAEHCEAGLTGGVDILVVAEDAQRMAGQRTCRYMEHAGQQLACYLIHVRNHQQETLRCGVGGGQRACLQRAVHGTGGACLALHLLYHHRLAEDVFTAGCRPVVHILRHRRRRSDGIDGGYFAEHVADVRCGLVAVARQKFLFLAHRVCYDILYY